jgi:hypothetical protein
MTTEVLRSMLYRGSEIVREAALVVRPLQRAPPVLLAPNDNNTHKRFARCAFCRAF